MVVQIDGGSSTNKGAQLMMVAVIQELKRRFPDAILWVNNNRPNEQLIKELYGGNCRILRTASFYRKVSKLHLVRFCGLFSRKLAMNLTEKHAIKGADVILNIGGFQFGDQWNHNATNVANWRDYLIRQHQFGAKTVFLPQAFGPFEKAGSKKIIEVLNDGADMLIARDDVSFNYLIKGGAKSNKVYLFPDFTASVEPQATHCSSENKGKVCIIPNSKIFQTGVMNKDSYLAAIVQVIEHIQEKGNEVFLLNHEGAMDYQLCQAIVGMTKKGSPIVTGLNALDTKGVIATSKLVISSRFHGVANSLSSEVPCLATSWSHKYQKLLEEYGQESCLLDLTNIEHALCQVDKMLEDECNKSVRIVLHSKNEEVKSKNREMWDVIWQQLHLID